MSQQTRGEGWEMKKKPAPSALAGFVGGWISQRGAKGREEDSDNVVRGNEDDSEDEELQAGETARPFRDGETSGSVVAQPTPPDLLFDENEAEAEVTKSAQAAGTSAQPSAVGRLWGRWRKPAAEAHAAPAKPTGDIDADGLDWLASAQPSGSNQQRHPPQATGQSQSSIDDLFDFDTLSVASTNRAKAPSQQVLPPRPATSTPPYRDEPRAAAAAASAGNDDWSWLDAAASSNVAKQPTSSFASPPTLRPASNGPSSVRPAVQLLAQTSSLNRSASAGKRPVLLPPPPPPSGRYSPNVAQQAAARPSASSSSSPAMATASSVPTFDFLSTPLPPNRPSPTPSHAGAVVLPRPPPPPPSTAAQPSQSRGPMTKDDLLFFESMG